MSIVPLLVIIQAFVLSTWSMVMLTAFLVTRDDESHEYATVPDLTSSNVIPD